MSKRFSNSISLTGNLKLESGGLARLDSMTIPYLECVMQVEVAPGEELTSTGLSQVHPILMTGRLCVETLMFMHNHHTICGSSAIFCTLQGYLHSWVIGQESRRSSLTVAENIGFHVNTSERAQSAEMVSRVISGELPQDVWAYFGGQIRREETPEMVLVHLQAEKERISRKPRSLQRAVRE